MKTILLIAMLATGATMLAQQATPAGNAENGKKLFLRDGCWECHGYAGRARRRAYYQRRWWRAVHATFAGQLARARPSAVLGDINKRHLGVREVDAGAEGHPLLNRLKGR